VDWLAQSPAGPAPTGVAVDAASAPGVPHPILLLDMTGAAFYYGIVNYF